MRDDDSKTAGNARDTEVLVEAMWAAKVLPSVSGGTDPATKDWMPKEVDLAADCRAELARIAAALDRPQLDGRLRAVLQRLRGARELADPAPRQLTRVDREIARLINGP